MKVVKVTIALLCALATGPLRANDVTNYAQEGRMYESVSGTDEGATDDESSKAQVIDTGLFEFEVTKAADENGLGGEVKLMHVYSGNQGTCEIPDTVEHEGIEYSVKTIATGAFLYNSSTRVVVPSSVETIEDHAFWEIHDVITELVLGVNVKYVGTAAFQYCEELLDVICLSPNAPDVLDLEGNRTFPAQMTLHISNNSVDSYMDSWIPAFSTVVAHKLDVHDNDVTLDVSDDAFQVTYSWSNSVKSVRQYVRDSFLTWVSDNEDVATVDANGVISPVAEGECVVTATSIFGEEKTISVTVTDENGEAITGVDMVTSDSANFRAYTLSGVEVTQRPLAPGFYVIVNPDGTATKRLISK